MKITDWLQTCIGGNKQNTAEMVELRNAAQELRIRDLAFQACVNMIANAVGRCEFQVYKRGKLVQDAAYYKWNVEPNKKQTSSAFMHKLIYTLLSENEALMQK